VDIMFELKTEIPRDRARAKIVQLGQLTADPSLKAWQAA
jgi:hypothetical protein